MGAAASTFNAESLGSTHEEKMKALLPDYYVEGIVITADEVELARRSWQMVVDDTSPEFCRLKSRPEGFEYRTCKHWFYDQFSVLSAESGRVPSQLYHATQPLKEKAISGMVEVLLSIYINQTADERHHSLRELAIVHANVRGVRCYQYALVGDMYMKTLQFCLGSGYTAGVELAWQRIFSVTFEVLLPYALEAEHSITHSKRK